MSGTKPTPGPWRLRQERQSEVITHWYICPVSSPDVQIADVSSWNLERDKEIREEAKANARAIGAVPDLIKALQASLDGHRATWMAARAEVEGAATAAALFEKEPEVIAARAALAKALEP